MNANGYDIVALVVSVAYGIAYFLLMRHERKQLDIAKRLDARRRPTCAQCSAKLRSNSPSTSGGTDD